MSRKQRRRARQRVRWRSCRNRAEVIINLLPMKSAAVGAGFSIENWISDNPQRMRKDDTIISSFRLSFVISVSVQHLLREDSSMAMASHRRFPASPTRRISPRFSSFLCVLLGGARALPRSGAYRRGDRIPGPYRKVVSPYMSISCSVRAVEW